MTGPRLGWGLLMLPLLVTACGGKQARDTAFREAVAQKFVDDSANIPPAPNAKMAQDLKTLVACSADRIRHSDIAYGDSDASISANIQAAMKYCTDQVYGKAKS